MAFVIAPQRGLPGALSNQFLGLFNDTNSGKSTNHVFAVELDNINNVEFDTVRGPHVGIDINGLKSVNSTSPAYFINGEYKELSLDKEPVQVWVEYAGLDKQIQVTLAPYSVFKPEVPLLTWSQDLSTIFLDSMYVGFSASTQSVRTYHYVLGWSFQIDGKAQALNLSSLPKIPQPPASPVSPVSPPRSPPLVIIWSAIGGSVLILALLVIFGLCYVRKPNRKTILEMDSSPPVVGLQKFSFSDLVGATHLLYLKGITKGFFGTVYHGALPNSEIAVSVKTVSRDATYRSKSKKFMEVLKILGKLRHPNLVQLYGYCKQEGELLLVYDFMPNGSLDKFLYPKENPSICSLKWSQRFQIIKDIASGLYYLHTGWEQVVIHGDIESSNVLLDGEMNARLANFGLAKLCDHGADSAPTSGAGGYIAPEMHIGMPSTQTDVYAFGALLLEIACGKRPNLVAEYYSGLHLVDWVLFAKKEIGILETADLRLRGEYEKEEMLLVLNLGLLCCHLDPTARPTIQDIVQFLSGDAGEADLRALQRYGRGGNTSLSGTYIGSTSSVPEAGPSVIRNGFTR